jgi:hypothetical protein
VAKIQRALQGHIVIYVGREHGFKLSGIPLSGELLINAALQSNLDKNAPRDRENWKTDEHTRETRSPIAMYFKTELKSTGGLSDESLQELRPSA